MLTYIHSTKVLFSFSLKARNSDEGGRGGGEVCSSHLLAVKICRLVSFRVMKSKMISVRTIAVPLCCLKLVRLRVKIYLSHTYQTRLHTASLKSRCFLFIFIILVFRLVRNLVFSLLKCNIPEGNTVFK